MELVCQYVREYYIFANIQYQIYLGLTKKKKADYNKLHKLLQSFQSWSTNSYKLKKKKKHPLKVQLEAAKSLRNRK